VSYPEGGGHFWVFMQYAQALRRLGCDVWWLERFADSNSPERDAVVLASFRERMKCYGFDRRTVLYREHTAGDGAGREYFGISRGDAESVFRRADLLLNFHYAIDPDLLASFRRTALVDIDPGLLQFWIGAGQLSLPIHDCYFTTGETVGTPAALFPDCGLHWNHIRPPVDLDSWPYAFASDCKAFTTVSGWWGGDGKGEWITDGKNVFYENNKRVSFMQFVSLPQRTDQILELALCLGEGDAAMEEMAVDPRWRPEHLKPEDVTDYVSSMDGVCAMPMTWPEVPTRIAPTFKAREASSVAPSRRA
jgi:hypothetical protein